MIQCTITIEKNGNYAKAEFSGSWIKGQEEEDAITHWSKISKVCSANGISRVLVISTLTGDLPILSAFSISESPDKFGWRRDLQTAIVVLEKETRKSNIFAEHVATNRGYWLKVFDDEIDAEAWLMNRITH